VHDHERFLWGLCYRMTGVAADADELVQETFQRALEKPPRDAALPLKPWLTQVAVNLARDRLRRRKREGYEGPWLPSPIDTADEPPPSVEPRDTEGRYDLMESVSFAFLLALEALNPKQRAVLLLRDVFDYSVKETAEALDVAEANVKVIHHRARAAMGAYERARLRPTADAKERHRVALERFLSALVSGDVPAVEAMLADSVVHLSDGGSEYYAAKVPVLGRKRVAAFMLRLTELRGPVDRGELRDLNALPALHAAYDYAKPKVAPRFTLQIQLDTEGKISAIYSVLSTRKLTQLLHPTGPAHSVGGMAPEQK